MSEHKLNLKTRSIIILLPVILGFFSGIVGYIFIAGNFLSLPFLGNVNFDNYRPGQTIVIDQPRQVTVEQDLQTEQVKNDLLPALINIYRSKNDPITLNNAYLPKDILTSGFILTADGRVVASLFGSYNSYDNYTAIGYQGHNFKLTGFVLDEATGLVFADMDTNQRPVARLGDGSQVASGQKVLVLYDNKISFANISHIGYDYNNKNDLILSSDELDKRIFLDREFDNSYNGALIANFKGEIIGIYDGVGAVPVDYLKYVINQVLSNNKISRPKLLINYIDLANVDGLNYLSDKGALVYGNPMAGSVAYGKLKDGDIIKKVNDIELNERVSLSEAIAGYKPTDNIELLVLRNSNEITVKVTLK